MKGITDKDVDNITSYIKQNEIGRAVEKVLFVLGFKHNLLGTIYLREAIILKYNMCGEICLYKELYSAIAQRYNTTYNRVERSMRHAINERFDSGGLMLANDLFKCQVIDSKYAPTNSEFISAMVAWFHLERTSPDK